MAYVHTIRATLKGQRSYCRTRDEQILKLRNRGWTLNELAERYHMTPQRAGQIVRAQERLARRKRKASLDG